MKPTSKEKIILATIECIEREGFQKVTVRDIAAQAGVNIASINYHFRTKEKLMEEALRFTLYTTTAEDFDVIEKTHTDPYSMLKALCTFFFEGALRYPNISRAHIYGPLVNYDYQNVFVVWLNEFSNRIAGRLENLIGPGLDKQHLRYAIAQMFSALLFWSLMPDLFDGFVKVDFRDPARQDEFIDCLIMHFLGVAGIKNE